MIEGGKILPPTHFEVIVTDHCNITCRSCNHGSPRVPRWLADPDVLYRDLSILAKVYRPRKVKVLGGEPLLHKDLPKLLSAVRASDFTDWHLLLSNGVLLDRMDSAIWELIEEIEISCYPGALPDMDVLARVKEEARAHGVTVTVTRYDEFRRSITTAGTQNDSLVEKIYKACKIAHVWGCHGTRDGYFYKCPQSMYISMLTGVRIEQDRIAIEEAPNLQERLLAFVNAPSPLNACRFCVGTVGKQHEHHCFRVASG